MTFADTFQTRLERGPLVLDGALGTELERRGIDAPRPLWSAAALRTAPQAVLAIHRAYVEAGADIIVADTFRTNPRALAKAGCRADGPALNALAVALAREAAGGTRRPEPVIVAASVAPVEDCYCPELVPDADTLRAEHAEMAGWLAAARPDLAWLETFGAVREACTAAAAVHAAGLPLAVSFVLREDGALLGGEPLAAAVAALAPFAPLARGVNCIPPRGVTAALPHLRQLTDRPLSAYAHINNPVPTPGWSFAEALAPAAYALAARAWLAAGARIVGGCCGTTPAHIAAVSEELHPRQRSPTGLRAR